MSPPPDVPLIYDEEEDDLEREAAVDGDHPLHVDRHIMQEIIEQKMAGKVTKIRFLSSGTFHKAFLILMEDGRELVFRIARRHMPRLKTESEVATLNYVRLHTGIPVPFVHHFDANPLNRMGGEYILMSKAPGVPLSKHYYHLHGDVVRRLLRNLAQMLVPLFSHRFNKTGSLYTNKTLKYYQNRQPDPAAAVPPHDYVVGPIVSWAYFGGSRGDNPSIDRGPWSSTRAYLTSATEREVLDLEREQSMGTHHRPHLPPEDYNYDSSTDISDNEEEHWRTQRWALSANGESDSESDNVGDMAYRDYRRGQRGSFLVAQAMERVEKVKEEMARFLKVMETFGGMVPVGQPEEFSLDMHDVSLENVFIDEEDHSKITCIIDWESTTVRPLWYCAHAPMMLEHAYPHPQLPPNTSATSVFLEEAAKVAGVGAEWAKAELDGQALRAAHRMIEWDGWEEGLADAILGPEDGEVHEGEQEGEPTLRGSSFVGFAAVVPGARGGLAVVQSASPRNGIGPKGGGCGVNGQARTSSGVTSKSGAGVDLAFLNGVTEGLRRTGLTNDQ